MPVNFQTGEKQRSRGKGASVITISLQLQEFSHASFMKARGEDGVASEESTCHTVSRRVSETWSSMGLGRSPLSLSTSHALPPTLAMLSFRLVQSLPTCPHHARPSYRTTFCLSTSPHPSSKMHMLARQRRRQSVGLAVPISLTRDMT